MKDVLVDAMATLGGRSLQAKAPQFSDQQVRNLAQQYYARDRDPNDLPPGLREKVTEIIADVVRRSRAGSADTRGNFATHA